MIKGARLEAHSGGQSASFKAPADHSGFHGLRFRALGYAGVGALKVSAP